MPNDTNNVIHESAQTAHTVAQKTADDKPKKSKKRNSKSPIYGICTLICIASISAIVAVVYFTLNKPIDNDYFVSDDTKTVISMTTDSDSSSTPNNGHVGTNIVYEYSGEDVVGMKTYFEYTDHDSAEKALETLKNLPEFKNGTVDGKYIVVTAEESQFKGLTASDVKQQAEALEQYQKTQTPKTQDTKTDDKPEDDEPEDEEPEDEEPEKE